MGGQLTMSNVGVRGANLPRSQKSVCNFIVSSLCLWFRIHGFNQLQIVLDCSMYLLKQVWKTHTVQIYPV